MKKLMTAKQSRGAVSHCQRRGDANCIALGMKAVIRKLSEGGEHNMKRFFSVILFLLILSFTSSCSIKKMAMKSVAGSMSSGNSVFQAENDPELVADALPFILMMYEIVLKERPDDPALLLASSKSFTMYSYGFLMTEAEIEDRSDFGEAMRLRRRATGLFLRARDYALRGLEQKHPGFNEELRKDYRAAIEMTDESDVDLLYWCGAAWAAALASSKDNLALLMELPISAAMVERVLKLDGDYSDGAAHDFFISYYGSRPKAMGGSIEKAREHFSLSLEISQGSNAGTYVSLATSVSIRTQNEEEFRALLEKALEVDIDAYPDKRLSNVIMQRKARWLLANTGEFFVGE
jgi:predicted anti-sigma-YlaC factor YlaD